MPKLDRSEIERLGERLSLFPRLWQEYDRPLAPAFVQEHFVGGQWSVQKLYRPTKSRWYRMLFKPPKLFYYGWPGDHRGWMNFQTKEDARDFYKFATGLMTMDEYNKIPRPPWSGQCINLDANGEFIDDAKLWGGE